MALVDLNLVRDHSGAELFVVGVLQVPPGLGLLHEAANRLFLDAFGQRLFVNDQPHLEVLDGVAVVVLGRALPRDDISALGRKAYLENILGREGGDDFARVGVDDVDPMSKSQKI